MLTWRKRTTRKRSDNFPNQGGYKAAFELGKNKNEEQTKKTQNFFL